jgi:hypothetical protein
MDLQISFVDLYVYLQSKTEKTSTYLESRKKVLKDIGKYDTLVKEMQKSQEVLIERVEERKSTSGISSKNRQRQSIFNQSKSGEPQSFNRDTEDAIKIIQRLSSDENSNLLLSI